MPSAGNVLVGVIDRGCNTNHEDLRGVVVAGHQCKPKRLWRGGAGLPVLSRKIMTPEQELICKQRMDCIHRWILAGLGILFAWMICGCATAPVPLPAPASVVGAQPPLPPGYTPPDYETLLAVRMIAAPNALGSVKFAITTADGAPYDCARWHVAIQRSQDLENWDVVEVTQTNVVRLVNQPNPSFYRASITQAF